MFRARRAGLIALSFALILVLVIASVATAARRPAGTSTAGASRSIAAAVPWPTSTLVVSEIETGAASASDEFAELANAGTLPVDLAGLEVVYVTSTGSTVTRKAAWTASRVLDPGRHILIANAAGIHAALADVTYSGGFAATGGAVVLRAIGGSPIDAVGWGDATSTFVEGSATPAPAAGSSIERRPGGANGNGSDSNDNLADFVVGVPNPQNLAAPATPDPSAWPSPTPSPTALPTPTMTPTPAASPSATPTPTPSPTSSTVPTPTPAPAPTPTPTPAPTPTPTPTSSPTPSPSPAPTPTPAPTATPTAVTAIVDARSMPDGTRVRVAGVLTTNLGAIDSARIGFVQDGTAGIALRLDASLPTTIPAGTIVDVEGTLGSYFNVRVLNVAGAAVTIGGGADLPQAIGTTTGGASEPLEGLRLAVEGTVTEAPGALADGLGVTIDDGSGPLRVIVSAAALAGQTVTTGDRIRASGPLGQRDSSGTGLAGYRLHATLPGELVLIAPVPTPTPNPTPTQSTAPTPTPTASSAPSNSPSTSPRPTASPTATPNPTPTPTATPMPAPLVPLASARLAPVGSRVTVSGVVTAEAGLLGTPPLIAIQDATAGIVVRLPDSAVRPTIGTRIELTGAIADPYGQTELRTITGLRATGRAAVPAPAPVDGASLGEATEARLVTVEGVAQGRPVKSTSGDLAFTITTAHGPVRIAADASAGLTVGSVAVGDQLRLVGIAGQHASRKGAEDGYRVWVRSPGDMKHLGGATASPSPSPTGGGSAGPSGAVRTIAAAILQ
nr:lamin tail domain-containing protein [Chloroflexota bacterium]